MPGTLLHLSFAQEVCKQLHQKIDCTEFMCGNLIPDEAIDKQQSHYRTTYGISGFFVPKLEKAKKELLPFANSLKIGMYCHLYLDYQFIANFLIPEFIWDYRNMQVTNPQNNKTWDFDDFFSKNGFYSAYSELNNLIIKNKVIDMDIVNAIPSILPQTGLSKFDTRRSKTWKEELDGYLTQNVEYTGDILNYDKVIDFLQRTARKFSYEMNY